MARFITVLSAKEIAEQISALLNAQNDLTKVYGAEDVLSRQADYFVEISLGKVVGCASIAWHSTDCSKISHLSVLPDYRKKGVGSRLLEKAIENCLTPLLIMTIKEHNQASISLAQKFGFQQYAIEKKPDYNVLTFVRRCNC